MPFNIRPARGPGGHVGGSYMTDDQQDCEEKRYAEESSNGETTKHQAMVETPATVHVTRDVTQATLSQALGTILYPITREIASWEERGIQGIKNFIRARRQEKLAAASGLELKGIRDKVASDATSSTAVARLLRAFDEAANHDMDDESLLALWRRLIARIRDGDHDTELLQEKLNALTPSEAHLLLEIGGGRRVRYGVHPVLAAISLRGSGQYYSAQREQQLAQSLRKKQLIEQRLPVRNLLAILAAFSPIFLMTLYPDSPGMAILGKLALPMFIVLLFLSMLLAAAFPPPIRPTWIGAKLLDGATVVEMTAAG